MTSDLTYMYLFKGLGFEKELLLRIFPDYKKQVNKAFRPK